MRGRTAMGVLDLGVGALVLWAVWFALPMRWAPVDVGGSVLGLAFLVAGAGLLGKAPWAARVGRGVAGVTLLVGAGLTIALAFTAGHLRGVYGATGNGGSIILAIVTFALVPYLVVFPAWKLWALLGPEAPAAEGGGTEAAS